MDVYPQHPLSPEYTTTHDVTRWRDWPAAVSVSRGRAASISRGGAKACQTWDHFTLALGICNLVPQNQHNPSSPALWVAFRLSPRSARVIPTLAPVSEAWQVVH